MATAEFSKFKTWYYSKTVFPGGSVVKNPPANLPPGDPGDVGSIPGVSTAHPLTIKEIVVLQWMAWCLAL